MCSSNKGAFVQVILKYVCICFQNEKQSYILVRNVNNDKLFFNASLKKIAVMSKIKKAQIRLRL